MVSSSGKRREDRIMWTFEDFETRAEAEEREAVLAGAWDDGHDETLEDDDDPANYDPNHDPFVLA
jgi:hypothetical protein